MTADDCILVGYFVGVSALVYVAFVWFGERAAKRDETATPEAWEAGRAKVKR